MIGVLFKDSKTIILILEALRGTHILSSREKKQLWFQVGILIIAGPAVALLCFLKSCSLSNLDGFFVMIIMPVISAIFFCAVLYGITRVYDFRKDGVVAASIFSFMNWSLQYKNIESISIDQGWLILQPLSGKVRHVPCIESIERILSPMALSLAIRVDQPVSARLPSWLIRMIRAVTHKLGQTTLGRKDG
jgi:hypothetical protein